MSVRDECRRRYGNAPCTRVYYTDGRIEETECGTWCPLLRRTIGENDDDPIHDDLKSEQGELTRASLFGPSKIGRQLQKQVAIIVRKPKDQVAAVA